MLATTEIIANTTTDVSTHVLPTKDQLERADLTLWDFLVPKLSMQHTEAVVEPVGDRRSAWWVLAEFGRRLGFELADPDGTDEEMLSKTLAAARCTYDEVAATGYVELPFEVPAPWVEQYLDRSGGWRLAPQILVDQLAGLEPPAPLVLVPRRQPRKLNGALDFLGETLEVQLHPDDASEAGVLDGQPVIVRTERGQVEGIAKVDPSIRRGAVSVPHGHHRVANVNLLTDKDVIDPVTGMVRYSGVPVTDGRPRPEAGSPERVWRPGARQGMTGLGATTRGRTMADGGRVVVVTGLGGMGTAVAHRLGPGATLVLADVNPEALHAAAEDLRAEGCRVEEHPTDVSDHDAVAALAAAADRLGRVEAVVHTAGVSPVQASAEAVLRVDLLGTALMLDEFGAVIAERGGGGLHRVDGRVAPPVDGDLERRLATTPTPELLTLPELAPDALGDPGIAYSIAKRANHLRVRAASILWGRRAAG